MQATLVTLFFAWVTAVLASPSTGFRNIKLSRNVDLTGSYVKEAVQVVAENVGSEPLTSYLVSIPEAEKEKIAIFEAQSKSGEVLGVQEAPPTDGLVLYLINLPEVIQPQGKAEFSYTEVLVNTIKPLPYEAKQLDPQLLSFEGNKYTLSLYPSDKQSLQLKFATKTVKDLTANEKSLKPNRNGIVEIGTWSNVDALSFSPLAVQFESLLGTTRVLNLERDIWVSHWGGTVSFDESYDVENDGTRLKGGFSRLDYAKQRLMMAPNLNAAAIKTLGIALPPGARETYYTDLVGNVSTSKVAPGILEVTPRYPIMGGWIYNFTVGWASDLAHFVREAAPQEFILSVPLLGGPGNAEYDRVHTRVILPEGAENIEVFDGFHDRLETDVVYNYLDLYGRPTVELEYSNMVSDHRHGEILVTYRYTLAAALRKPLTYVVGLLVVFSTALLLSRIDLSV